MSFSRRSLIGTSSAALAFAGLARLGVAREQPKIDPGYLNQVRGYGALQPDPNGLIDLPRGFSYRIFSRQGETMTDGLLVPAKHDGMGCFAHDDPHKVILVRNHEIKYTRANTGAFGQDGTKAASVDQALIYDRLANGMPCAGGTTTLVYDLKEQALVSHHLSLAGTEINCAGGVTPWGSWLTCEETVTRAGPAVGKDHGYVFEVPSRSNGLVAPLPIKEMGRFEHEACAVDPETGIVYMTQDHGEGVLYRFIPNIKGELHKGGQLQALRILDHPKAETSNHKGHFWKQGQSFACDWVDLNDPESPNSDIQQRAYELGCARFARAEGICWGKGEFYFIATTGGKAEYGQILRYRPFAAKAGEALKDTKGKLQLFYESHDLRVFDYGDNLVVSPWGHLFVCEDRYSDTLINHLRIVTPNGKVTTFAAHRGADNSEWAGVCFSPDGTTLFANLQTPGITVAITGPFGSFQN